VKIHSVDLTIFVAKHDITFNNILKTLAVKGNTFCKRCVILLLFLFLFKYLFYTFFRIFKKLENRNYNTLLYMFKKKYIYIYIYA